MVRDSPPNFRNAGKDSTTCLVDDHCLTKCSFHVVNALQADGGGVAADNMNADDLDAYINANQ
jgi:hypothetical protein